MAVLFVCQKVTWVYQHPCYVTCSSVDFESVFPLFLQNPAVQFCSQDDHALMETFFNDNQCILKNIRDFDLLKETIKIEKRMKSVIASLHLGNQN